MLVHIDNVKYKCKPSKMEIGGIKKRFTKSESVKDVTAEQLAKHLTCGRTVQPGVTPFSEKSRLEGKKGTVKEDFARQTVFMNDIDNERKDIPSETPEHVAEVLGRYNLKAAFMYETFNSTPDDRRFRFALVSDTEFTDKAERDRLQAAIIAAFPQSDIGCTNADRIYFGTDKGLIVGFTDFSAVCAKDDLMAFADEFYLPETLDEDPINPASAKSVRTIPVGQRHNTLVSFASAMLKKYGVCEQACEAYMERVGQCEEPMPEDEIKQIWHDACSHYESTIATNPEYVPPSEYKAQDYADIVMPTDYTDVGQARVFVNLYGEKLRYSAATKWLVYDGKKWNESELHAQRLAQELTDRQLADARKRLKLARARLDAAVEAGDDDKQEAAKKEVSDAMCYRAFVLDRRKTSRITATLTEARPAVEISVQELDKEGFKLNTPNGIVDLRTRKIYPHDPKDYCTKMTAVSPSLDGMDEWRDFLDRLTCGDKSLQDYLQICSGMEAVGGVYVEKLSVAYGRGGNGKSTFYNAKARVLGDYAGSLSAETLTVNCRKNKSPEYAELRGKRLVIAAELEEGMRLDTAIVKKLCSTDPIQAEKKYKDPFNFKPSHSTVLYTNHLPKVGTTDNGTWDRLVVVPFNARFRWMQDEVMNYTEYLVERCGGAILLWIIEGARRFIAAHYHIEQPDCVKSAIAEYRFDNDWLNTFIEECCIVAPEHEQRAGDLYDAYRTYCNNKREWARGSGDFKAALTGAGFNWRKTATGAFYYGLRLKSDFEDENAALISA